MSVATPPLRTPLLSTGALAAFDLCCSSPRSGPSAERGGEPTHLALPRRGVFGYHLGARSFVGDASTALLHRGAASYRVSHPGAQGDEVTIVELGPALADELVREPARVAWGVPAEVQLMLHRLRAALRATPPPSDGEERLLELLGAIVHGPRVAAPGRRDRRLVDAVKARLGAELDRNLPLTTLATEVGASPFHLMRTFRAVTGVPVRAYRRRLRVLAALAALSEGERDLASLAVRLGFSHHGHLCDAFRAVLGITPGAARRIGARRARTFLEARPEAGT